MPAEPRSPSTSQIGLPAATASSSSRVTVAWPMPRGGVLMIRSSETSSRGLTSSFEVGQHVADFLAVEERHAADQHVGHLGPPQFHLERPRLLVGAEEDGEIAAARRFVRDRSARISSTTVLASVVFVLELQDPRRLAADGAPAAPCRAAAC